MAAKRRMSFNRIASMSVLQFVLVGCAAGWIMGIVRRGHGYGLLGNLLVGAVGALIGAFLAGFLKFKTNNIFGQIFMAVVGAIVFFLGVAGLKWQKKRL